MEKKQRKVRQCPYCKSKKGFSIMIFLGGYEEKQMTFEGKLINQDRFGTDDIEKWGSCLECKKTIDVELLELKNV